MGQNFDSVGAEEGRQAVSDCLVGIHHVDHEVFVLHEPLPEPE